MSFIHDKQIKNYFLFLFFFLLALFASGAAVFAIQTGAARTMLLSHDEAIAASLIEQGVAETVIAKAITNTKGSPVGSAFLHSIGITPKSAVRFLPFFSPFRKTTGYSMLVFFLLLFFLLLSASFLFFWKREHLYKQGTAIVRNYIEGDHSLPLPQMKEGSIYELFSSVEQLAAMLQAKNESGQKTKEFLKNTISDISHQLKTPLAALTMYQEIMENEPDNPAVIREFSTKTGQALRRMEQLIQAMLKITRLDAGNIIFEKNVCKVSELIQDSISELVTRLKTEQKELIINGSETEVLVCDRSWTMEAVENIVKNATDHTKKGDTIRVSWESSPTMQRILITDTGSGIAPEDIHHIFKRFYRSRQSLDTQGVGLGLSLAKSIVEGQGGVLSVHSLPGEGTTFTLSFPA